MDLPVAVVDTLQALKFRFPAMNGALAPADHELPLFHHLHLDDEAAGNRARRGSSTL